MKVKRKNFEHDIVYEFCAKYKGVREDGTLTGYRWSSRHFIEFLDQDRQVALEDVDWTDVDAFIRDMVETYPDTTVKTRYNHLRSFFQWLQAHKDYYADRDQLPVDHDEFSITEYIDRGKTAKQTETAARGGIVFITPDEYEKLVNHVPSPKFRNELILKMLWHLGLRRKEVVDTKITPQREDEGVYGNIDFDANRLDVPAVKGEGRPLWFRDSLAVTLKRWIRSERKAVYHAAESNYLFPSRNSDQLSPKRVSTVVAEAAENAGIQTVLYEDANGHERRRITPHAFRHGFAVRHVRNGTNIKVLNDLLGHEDLSTTQIYLQFDDATKRDAQHRNAPQI